jgi:DNA-binding transcriptional MerR regulator
MYSIQEISQKTGLSAHTLRYYEKEGLIKGVERSEGGFRQYSEEDLEALGLICCLKNTGMSLKEIARFVDLTHQGEHTLRERVDMLRAHRERVIGRMNEMRTHLDKVTWKLNFFTEKLKDYEDRQDAALPR